MPDPQKIETQVQGLLHAKSSVEAELDHLLGALGNEREVEVPSLLGVSVLFEEIRKNESALISLRSEIDALIATLHKSRGDFAAERMRSLVARWSVETPPASEWCRIKDEQAVSGGRELYAALGSLKSATPAA